jgi:sensor histidine kinase YesM
LTLLYLVAYTKLIIWNVPEMAGIWHFKPMFNFVISRHSTYYYLAFWATVGLEHALGYYRRFHERELLTSRLESRLARARLDRLRDQLHPHFLFNTLNTISSMILKDKKLLAYDTLTSLSELLRISLERSDLKWTSLREELEFSRLYLELLAARFPDNLEVKWDVAEGVEECAVPSLLLQPLIENCVKHGAVGQSHHGIIEVSAHKADQDGTIEIAVVNDLPEKSSETQGAGLGLKHVSENLHYLYRGDAMMIHEQRDGSFVVTLKLPYRQYRKEMSDFSVET